MPSFLDDITPFLGTKEKNELGQNLGDFLEEYNPKNYDNPSVTVDTLVIQYKKNVNTVSTGLKLLMVKRRNHPSIGFWALPGGFVDIRENLMDAARRELQEETGLTHVSMEQLYTWGEAWRDPRARIITISYLALIEEISQVKAGDDAIDAAWMDVKVNKLVEPRINEDSRTVSTYELKLTNMEKQLEVSAIVEVSKNQCGLLKELDYRVLESDGIAFDHARVIIQALLYIEELIKE